MSNNVSTFVEYGGNPSRFSSVAEFSSVRNSNINLSIGAYTFPDFGTDYSGTNYLRGNLYNSALVTGKALNEQQIKSIFSNMGLKN